jgi:hypothetical protein
LPFIGRRSASRRNSASVVAMVKVRRGPSLRLEWSAGKRSLRRSARLLDGRGADPRCWGSEGPQSRRYVRTGRSLPRSDRYPTSSKSGSAKVLSLNASVGP